MTQPRPHIFRLSALAGDGLRSLMGAVDALAAVASPEGRRRVLVDLRPLALPRTEAVILCHHLGTLLTGSRVAVLVSEPLPEGETVAKLAGGRLRSFTQDEAAVAWLESLRVRKPAGAPLHDIVLEPGAVPPTAAPSAPRAATQAEPEFADSTL